MFFSRAAVKFVVGSSWHHRGDPFTIKSEKILFDHDDCKTTSNQSKCSVILHLPDTAAFKCTRMINCLKKKSPLYFLFCRWHRVDTKCSLQAVTSRFICTLEQKILRGPLRLTNSPRVHFVKPNRLKGYLEYQHLLL